MRGTDCLVFPRLSKILTPVKRAGEEIALRLSVSRKRKEKLAFPASLWFLWFQRLIITANGHRQVFLNIFFRIGNIEKEEKQLPGMCLISSTQVLTASWNPGHSVFHAWTICSFSYSSSWLVMEWGRDSLKWPGEEEGLNNNAELLLSFNFFISPCSFLDLKI